MHIMEIRQARRILGVDEWDDEKNIKMKFRRLMGRYHPDALGSDMPEHVKRAQQINEAYSLLKSSFGKTEAAAKPGKHWDTQINQNARISRNIYVYGFPDEDGLIHVAAKGKYMWDPDKEDFRLFLRSVNHASQEILEDLWRECGVMEEELSREFRFQAQLAVFHQLTAQFLNPLECFHKIAGKSEQEIYCFSAALGADRTDSFYKSMSRLRPGEQVYPDALQNNRIMISDRNGSPLGHLSLENDALYFCLIPILKAHKAQVKFIVREVITEKNRRPMRLRIKLDFLVRMETDIGSELFQEDGAKLEKVLKKWKHAVQSTKKTKE